MSYSDQYKYNTNSVYRLKNKQTERSCSSFLLSVKRNLTQDPRGGPSHCCRLLSTAPHVAHPVQQCLLPLSVLLWINRGSNSTTCTIDNHTVASRFGSSIYVFAQSYSRVPSSCKDSYLKTKQKTTTTDVLFDLFLFIYKIFFQMLKSKKKKKKNMLEKEHHNIQQHARICALYLRCRLHWRRACGLKSVRLIEWLCCEYVSGLKWYLQTDSAALLMVPRLWRIHCLKRHL